MNGNGKEAVNRVEVTFIDASGVTHRTDVFWPNGASNGPSLDTVLPSIKDWLAVDTRRLVVRQMPRADPTLEPFGELFVDGVFVYRFDNVRQAKLAEANMFKALNQEEGK